MYSENRHGNPFSGKKVQLLFSVLVMVYYFAVLSLLKIWQERLDAGRVYDIPEHQLQQEEQAVKWEAIPALERPETVYEMVSKAEPSEAIYGTAPEPGSASGGDFISMKNDITGADPLAEYRKNPDFAGMLEIPALSLRYPFVYSRDNMEYLTHLIDGTENRAGCIFMDMKAQHDLRGANTILFGHNMRDTSMFGSLRLFSQDFSLAEEQPFIYLETDHESLTYRIFLFGTVRTDDYEAYVIPKTQEAYDRFISHMCAVSAWIDTPASRQVLARRPCVLTLSTCWGDEHKENFVVLAALEDRKACPSDY